MIKHFFQIACLVVFCLQAQAQKLYSICKPAHRHGKMGHTYPGATAPFGSVQLSPDTRHAQLRGERQVQSGGL